MKRRNAFFRALKTRHQYSRNLFLAIVYCNYRQLQHRSQVHIKIPTKSWNETSSQTRNVCAIEKIKTYLWNSRSVRGDIRSGSLNHEIKFSVKNTVAMKKRSGKKLRFYHPFFWTGKSKTSNLKKLQTVLWRSYIQRFLICVT